MTSNQLLTQRLPTYTERGDVVKDPEKYLKKLRKRS
jgi:hypothetical protein